MSPGIAAHGVFWWYSSENLSPLVTTAFLERQRRLLSPQQYNREHANQWVDRADSFTSDAEVTAAMSQGWVEQTHGRSGAWYVMFADLGLVANPSVLGVGHESQGRVYIDTLKTFQGSRAHPVQLADVELEIVRLARVFHPMPRIHIESWQGVSAVQRLQMRGYPIEIFTPTAKAHAEQWPVLQQRLASRTLVCFPHKQLREELLNLVVELGPTGTKVVDPGHLHQDHCVVVRGLCAMLQPAQAPQASIAFIQPNTGGSAPSWQDNYFR